MAILKAQKLRALDSSELEVRLAELEKELYELRVGLTTKEQENTALMTQKRREYARTLTIFNEKKREAAAK